jgi:hypothetical protein
MDSLLKKRDQLCFSATLSGTCLPHKSVFAIFSIFLIVNLSVVLLLNIQGSHGAVVASARPRGDQTVGD